MQKVELLERVRNCRSYSNALDIEIDLALFRPDSQYLSVKPNAAGTKLVYRLADGSTRTCWAADHTLNKESIDRAVRKLTAISQGAEMTTSDTVTPLSAERLATLCSEWPKWLSDAVEAAMSASDEHDWSTEQVIGYALLALRTQSPAEWQVEVKLSAIMDALDTSDPDGIEAAEAEVKALLSDATPSEPVTISPEGGVEWLRETAMNLMLATEVEEGIRILTDALRQKGNQS